MGLVINSLLICIILILIYFKWIYSYWKRRGVPFLEPQIPFGNIKKSLFFQEHISVSLSKFYQEIKRNNWKFGGIFSITKPALVITDLDLVKNVMTKDFQHFQDRDAYVKESDALQAHLLNLRGDKWRSLRAKLTPTFTSGKMKLMFGIMSECALDLNKRMQKECGKAINIKEILACFTTNIIGSCAFGLECKALEDDNSPFRKIGKRMMSMSKWVSLKRTLSVIFPNLFKFLNVSTARRQHGEFILGFVKKTIDYRTQNNVSRNDFLQMMMELMKTEDGFTLDDVGSQCSVFFGAGFETSSTLMTFALYELSKDQEAQEKLRKEIQRVLQKHENQVSYDSIQDMVYLNQVIDETLRIHPPAGHPSRVCTKDYQIPDTNIVIKTGTKIYIPVLGIHLDPEIYPEPEKFDPERFSVENSKDRHNYAHLPFGEGPRNCIGMRFGLLQSKIGLVTLLTRFKFSLNGKTQEPLFYDPTSIVLSVFGDIWLDAQEI